MINYKVRVKNLIKKYGTRNPYSIALSMDIEIIEKFLSPQMPTAFFKKVLRRKFIVINLTKIRNDSDKYYALAHELGHVYLHSSDRMFFLHDHTNYQRGRFEIEANRFAAELLIDESEIDKIALREMCTSQLSQYFGVPIELVEYKFME
ncbi:MAG: ImmA/IrrE family metallo-endopeptidase [Clostridiaceae bacterium]